MKDDSSQIVSDVFTRGEKLISDDLNALSSGATGKGLNLTGIEVISFLAAKMLVPIVAAFVKDVLYEKYKNLRTRGAAEEAKQQLLKSAGPFKLQIDRSTIIREMSESLCEEGVPASVAQKAAEDTLKYVEEALISRKR